MYMPTQNDPSAPKFNGSPKVLALFLEEIEYLREKYGLNHNLFAQQLVMPQLLQLQIT